MLSALRLYVFMLRHMVKHDQIIYTHEKVTLKSIHFTTDLILICNTIK